MRVTTVNGTTVDLFNLQPEDIRLTDIAIALSNLCRFNGQLPSGTFYNVAQHSMVLADYFTMQNYSLPHAQFALLHDAAEAYIGDMAHPIKANMREFVDLERIVERNIMRKYLPGAFGDDGDLDSTHSEVLRAVLDADRELCHTEAHFIWAGAPPAWAEQPNAEMDACLDRCSLFCPFEKSADAFLAFADWYGIKD